MDHLVFSDLTNSAMFSLYNGDIDPNKIILTNNLFKNNDFSQQQDGPWIRPQASIVDGGGNKCLVSPPSYDHPLTCISSLASPSNDHSPVVSADKIVVNSGEPINLLISKYPTTANSWTLSYGCSVAVSINQKGGVGNCEESVVNLE